MYNMAMESKIEIGQRLKNRRLALNLRMDDLAKQAGITRSTLWSIEKGSGNYSIDALLRLTAILGMTLDLGDQENGTKRKRATRTNTAMDKKTNRFIVMCVEQYAAKVRQGSGAVYEKLSRAGIIAELEEDYEDMHGMSTYSINEYIAKRLKGGAV